MTKPAYSYDELDEIFRGKGDDDIVGMSLIDGLIATSWPIRCSSIRGSGCR